MLNLNKIWLKCNVSVIIICGCWLLTFLRLADGHNSKMFSIQTILPRIRFSPLEVILEIGNYFGNLAQFFETASPTLNYFNGCTWYTFVSEWVRCERLFSLLRKKIRNKNPLCLKKHERVIQQKVLICFPSFHMIIFHLEFIIRI